VPGSSLRQQCAPFLVGAAVHAHAITPHPVRNTTHRFVQAQTPLAYQPLNQLFCVRAKYIPLDPKDLSKGVRVCNYANTGAVNTLPVGTCLAPGVAPPTGKAPAFEMLAVPWPSSRSDDATAASKLLVRLLMAMQLVCIDSGSPMLSHASSPSSLTNAPHKPSTTTNHPSPTKTGRPHPLRQQGHPRLPRQAPGSRPAPPGGSLLGRGCGRLQERDAGLRLGRGHGGRAFKGHRDRRVPASR